jgi:hypothetical protein
MSYQWGRPSDAGAWPRQKYLTTLGVLVLALAAAIAVGWFHYRLRWTPLQRLYFPSYMRSYLLASLAARRPLRPAACDRSQRPPLCDGSGVGGGRHR